MKEILTEPSRNIPIADEFDVAVCGGGPAGIGAALRAAREGARTILIEQFGCLGGIWTVGCLSWLLDHENKSGIMQELCCRLDYMSARVTGEGKPGQGFDVEKMKLLLEELCREADVNLRYYTRVVAARVEKGRLSHAVLESASGREALAAECFVDCTGNGDLGMLAGCGFDVGHPETGATQPMSMIAILTGLDPEAVSGYYRRTNAGAWAEPKDRLRADMERGGHTPSYGKPSLFEIGEGLFALMANHEYGYSALDADDLTRATVESRREVHQLVAGLRWLGGVWKDVKIVATSAQIGTREGRRLHGLYTVSREDLVQGARHEDAVCRVTFPVDVHSTDPSKTSGIEPAEIESRPYDIPLRALIARDVDGLLMAGRCISGDFLAHSSYRVTGNAVALGEAAGRTAARAVERGKVPGDLSVLA